MHLKFSIHQVISLNYIVQINFILEIQFIIFIIEDTMQNSVLQPSKSCLINLLINHQIIKNLIFIRLLTKVFEGYSHFTLIYWSIMWLNLKRFPFDLRYLQIEQNKWKS